MTDEELDALRLEVEAAAAEPVPDADAVELAAAGEPTVVPSELEAARPGPRAVVIASDPRDGSGERLEFVHEGVNDPEMVAVALKYRAKMSDPNLDPAERKALGVRIMREVRDAKLARAAPPPPPAPAPAPPTPQRKRTKVQFSLGPFGTHTVGYDHAQVADNVVLLAALLGAPDGYYEPPVGQKMIVVIDGCPVPLVVMRVGSFPFNGYHQLLLLVVDPDDDPSGG